jgi:hypothetical protein
MEEQTASPHCHENAPGKGVASRGEQSAEQNPRMDGQLEEQTASLHCHENASVKEVASRGEHFAEQLAMGTFLP